MSQSIKTHINRATNNGKTVWRVNIEKLWPFIIYLFINIKFANSAKIFMPRAINAAPTD